MWILVVIVTAAASYTPGVQTILQAQDEQTCLVDRQRLVDTGAVNPNYVLCLQGEFSQMTRGGLR